MTPPATASVLADPPKPAVGQRSARSGGVASGRGTTRARPRRAAAVTYDPGVSVPEPAIHEQHRVSESQGDVDEPMDLEGAGPAGMAEGPPASADDPVSPGSSITLFEQAVEQNSRRLLAIARAIVGYRASPEDVVQQAVMNLYRHRARYDWRKPGGLLKRAVVNEALRLLRPPRMTMVADDHPAAFRAPSSDLETNETVRKVREAIDQLPDHFRAALVLCEYEGMSYAQIAETLEASIPQIKTWLHRARRKLATILEPYVNEQAAAGQQ